MRKREQSKARYAGRTAAKRIFALILGIALAVSLGGCATRDERLAWQYLKRKYPEQEFTLLGHGGEGSWFGPSDRDHFVFYLKGGDPVQDRVDLYIYFDTDENGEKTFEISDDYYGILIREDAEADVVNLLSDLNVPAKSYIGYSGFYYEDDDRSKTYAMFKEEVISGKRGWEPAFSIFILCKELEDVEAYADQVFEKLKKDGIQRRIVLYLITDENIYNSVSRETENEIYRLKDNKTVFAFSKSLNFAYNADD